MIAGVRRVRKPGCKFDEALILESEQGKGKSTALKVLAGGDEHFTDALQMNSDSKVVIEQSRGKWIIELPELSGMKKAEVESVKANMARTSDRARGAYGRIAEEIARSFVFAGTTNSDKYLSDPTGNRRFWPVKVGTIDLAALKRDRDQLWAEAATRERARPRLVVAQVSDAARAPCPVAAARSPRTGSPTRARRRAPGARPGRSGRGRLPTAARTQPHGCDRRGTAAASPRGRRSSSRGCTWGQVTPIASPYANPEGRGRHGEQHAPLQSACWGATVVAT